MCIILERSNEMCKSSWFHKVYTINKHLLGAVAVKMITLSFCEEIIFSIKISHAHLQYNYNVCVSFQKIQQNLYGELILYGIQYEPSLTRCSCHKIANAVILWRNIFQHKKSHTLYLQCMCKFWKDPTKALRGVIFTKYTLFTITD